MISPTTSTLVALLLGARHGLDADHLSAIDGLTRTNSQANPRLARLCGLYFSMGHAATIVATTAILTFMSNRLAPPDWLEAAGALISGIVLAVLGGMNLRAAVFNRSARPLGLRTRAVGRLLRVSTPGRVALVGALFALSLDALAVAAFFASSAGKFIETLVCGATFAAGLIAIGVANGLWLARLLRHSSGADGRATRVMTLTIAIVALSVSARMLLPLIAPIDDGISEFDPIFSALVIILVFAGYVTSLRVARAKPEILIDPPVNKSDPTGADTCAA